LFGVGAFKVSTSKTVLSSIKNAFTLNFYRLFTTWKTSSTQQSFPQEIVAVFAIEHRPITPGDLTLNTPLGNKIREERKRLKLTLDELAAKTNSSKSYIWELENRPVVRPSADKISKIAEVFGVTVEYLLDDDRKTPTTSDIDAAFFRKVSQLNDEKRAQLEKFLKAIDDD
jgi:transcriptional regulator with XRE-family HTH domain